MSFHDKIITAKTVAAKHVRAKDVKAKKLHACEGTVDHLKTNHVEATSATFDDVVVKNTLTIPAMGLKWAEVAEVNMVEPPPASEAGAEDDRDVAVPAMIVDFMIPVTTPTAVAGRMRAGFPSAPSESAQVGADMGNSPPDYGTDSDDDVVVEKCQLIKKCLRVGGDTTIAGNLIVEGKIYTKCVPHDGDCDESSVSTVDADLPGEDYCRVKCRCGGHGHCSSSSSSSSSSPCRCGLEDINALKARLSALEALVASLHP